MGTVVGEVHPGTLPLMIQNAADKDTHQKLHTLNCLCRASSNVVYSRKLKICLILKQMEICKRRNQKKDLVSAHLKQPCLAEEHEIDSGDGLHICGAQAMQQCGRQCDSSQGVTDL